MSVVYFSSSFGGIDLRITSLRTEGGRDVAVRSPARGNRHWNQDRGRRHGITVCDLIFCDEPNRVDYLSRYAQFRDLANQGDVSAFTHPLDGTYLARAGEMTVTAQTEKSVSVSVTFYPEDEPDPTTPLSAGVAPVAGLESVTAAAGLVSAAVKLTPTIAPKDAIDLLAIVNNVIDKVQSWADAVDLKASKVLAEVGTMTGDIAQAVEVYELATDVKRWAAYRAVMDLMFQSRRAAEMFIDDEPASITVEVAKTSPLLAILVEVYGAELAVDMVEPVTRKNKIPNPGRVLAGTTLTCPGTGAL